MTNPAGFSRATDQSGQQIVAIVSVDTVGMKAQGRTRQESTIPIDLRYYVGAVHVIPARGDQWVVRRFGAAWILANQLPYNTTELLSAADTPVEGLTQVGSTNPNGVNPLQLSGSSVEFKAPFLILGGTWYRDNVGVFEKSTNQGSSWIPVAAGDVTVNLDWDDLIDKPTTFPPTLPIDWTDLDNVPVTFPPTLPTGTADDVHFWAGDGTWKIPEGTGGGAPGDAEITVGEVPSGTVNGSNTVFTLTQLYTTGSTMVYRSGVRQLRGTDYTESGLAEITFADAPIGGDVLEVDYVADGAPGALVSGETPSGTKNGINTTFTLAHVPATNTTSVFRNGLREQLGIGYTESTNTIVFTTPPLTSDILLVDYLLPA